MKSIMLCAVLLAASFAVTPAHAQQCPTCTIAAGSTSGTCSNAATVTCTSDADCVAAAVTAACPCDGQTNAAGQAMAWKNHGQYTSCVSRARNALRKQGCLTPQAQGKIQSCAARSTCGKTGFVVCCRVTSAGTCTGASPGVPGTCSNDPTMSCNADPDCTVLGRTTIAKASACTGNRYPSGTGSACSACEAAVACCVPSGTTGQPGSCELLTATDCTSAAGTQVSDVPSCGSVTCP